MNRVNHMFGLGLRKPSANHSIKECRKVRSENRSTKLEKFCLETLFICCFAASQRSDGLNNTGVGEQMALWRWSGVKRWLPRNVVKCNDMGGQRVVIESGGQGGAPREKGTPKDLGILNKRGAKGFALKRGKRTFLVAKKTEVQKVQMGEGRRLSLKGDANRAIESFAISIKPFIHRTSIPTLSFERGRGTVRNRKESRIPDGRGK